MAVAAFGQLNVLEVSPWGSRSVDCFQKLEQVGKGTYGLVYMAREINTGEIVALKKIRMGMDTEKDGFPMTAIREIKILKKLHHENIIKLKEIVTSQGSEIDEQRKSDGIKYNGSIYMVFEYMDHDLTGLAHRPGLRFTIPQIKCYMKQLLTGLHYCHINQVLHRDIKDFGLARSYSNDQNANLTNRVVTLWYRPPELLFGATKYGPAVDMWSVACIFAELLNGNAILPGRTEPDQLKKIFELCGSPDEINWPGVSRLPCYNEKKPSLQMKRRVRDVFKLIDHHALDLLDKMLTLDPSQRISVKDALDAEYFWTDPLPCDPKSLPKYESSHEFQTKKKREQQQQNEEMAKRRKIQHRQQHAHIPPVQHTGQAHASHWTRPNHPVSNSQIPASSGPSHYGKSRGPPGGPNRYVPSGNQSGGGGYYPARGNHGGGYNPGSYPPQGRGQQYSGNSGPSTGFRGPSGGNGACPTEYSQGGRAQNPSRNQQCGWQQ